MCPNLMCAPGAKINLQKSEIRELLFCLPTGQRGASKSQSRRHACTIPRIPRDWLFDPALTLQTAFHQREISLPHLPRSKLRGQIAMCSIVLRDQQNATGEPVQPVYDSRTQFAAYSRKRREPMQQRIHQSTVMHSRARMDKGKPSPPVCR